MTKLDLKELSLLLKDCKDKATSYMELTDHYAAEARMVDSAKAAAAAQICLYYGAIIAKMIDGWKYDDSRDFALGILLKEAPDAKKNDVSMPTSWGLGDKDVKNS
jgi:hypothetical protein